MKRAAILVLAIATLVAIVSPSAYPLASTTFSPTKSGTGPGIVSGSTITPGPTTTSGGGTGGGTDQGDADGLSGLKVKPATQSNYSAPAEWVAITLMMWWRYMVLIR